MYMNHSFTFLVFGISLYHLAYYDSCNYNADISIASYWLL
jgi:hypothetical protein